MIADEKSVGAKEKDRMIAGMIAGAKEKDRTSAAKSAVKQLDTRRYTNVVR